MLVKDVDQEAIFIGCNKQSYVSDFNDNAKLVAFGACNTVALWHPVTADKKGVYFTLKKHSKEVTGVRFIPESDFLVSVGEDGEVNIWKKKGDIYELHQSLKVNEHSITCLSVQNKDVFLTGGSDGRVCLWVLNKETQEYFLLQDFEVKLNFYPTTLALQSIVDGHYTLAVGGTSSLIFVYSFVLSNSNEMVAFEKAAELSGHEDWIKCLTFATEAENESYILASGSQDRYIRLWRLNLGDSIDDSDEDDSKLILLSNKQYKFHIGSIRAAFSFDALIMGHDDWVTCLKWHPSYTFHRGQKTLQLLSCSADTSLMIWEMDKLSGIWCCVSRLGELSIKGASTATGASGGFWSCLWFSDQDTKSQYILANGKTGSFRVYESVDGKSFNPALGITGAIRDVTDVIWANGGRTLMATSLDQTTRLFAPWSEGRSHRSWHEFSRPQIHGYDMICLDSISPVKFVSGGDEKILRVFEVTLSVCKQLKTLSGIDISSENNEERLPGFASLPVLGLSNKAESVVEQSETSSPDLENTTDYQENEEELSALTSPPLEDHLQRFTLYPEIEKLYGHGYEMTCCCTNPGGTLIASACKSNSAKHAVIRIFKVKDDYQQCNQTLSGHNLTVTSMEFSDNGKYLLAVSRDRQYSLWEVADESSGSFRLIELNERAHSRIIWDCSWVPCNPYGTFFLTASRDKQVKLWSLDTNVVLEGSVKLHHPVTSISCYLSTRTNGILIIAAGLENGDIVIISSDLREKNLKTICTFDPSINPASRINKLALSLHLSNNSQLLLGVGSSDSSTRIYSLNFKDI
ncbi:uncharacterized protein PRCAT00003651001 [Priceomyces carsonii]|uniref:uncharacterized protein n=1 Tax=Priceomyces carsonii TaxID=28549 RepID=UPI002EDBB548|nr:unnamed protein product [Priceomyces carsonii]